MIDILSDYIWRSLPERDFVTNPNLEKKVTETGKMRPYQGNTTIFLLNEKTKKALHRLQNELYVAVPHLLAERLPTDTFLAVLAISTPSYPM